MKIVITIGIVMLLLASGFIILNDDRVDDDIKILNDDDYKERNYYGEVLLGIAPSAIPRESSKKDIDTGIKLKKGDTIYKLYESRTWKTLDYGNTFLDKIE